ncbi:MAG: tRNA (adenosine(37)-N6)-threonylcarbamoyltransferase complex ATPase subunit type 1 TsaE [Desulfobacterales bacterium]|nr:tRNA (adenosine(37)-N6)-threonylcarbamoyltransferase complex ATPase subunit type 1 TsaE [Desulfobacterales bacterium]
MSAINTQIEVKTRSAGETRELGREIGVILKQPLSIALAGDLGSGKTVFVQGLAKGLEVPDDYYITSPTFTLINEYPGRLPLFHVDLYRLETVRDLEDIGLEELRYDQGVLAIEWADKLVHDYFHTYLSVQLYISDENSRRIRIIAYGQTETDLIKALGMRIQNIGITQG